MNGGMWRGLRPAPILWGLMIATVLCLGLATPASAQTGVSATFDPATGRLTVTGDDTDNRITVSRDAAGTLLVTEVTRRMAIPITGGTPTVANTTLIVILGLGGNDELRLDQANGALPAANIDGGPGNDVLIGGSGNDILIGGDGNDIADGNQGNDTARLGAGDDIFIWDPGDGSDIVEGQAGRDTLRFNGANVAEQIDVSANGPRARFFRNPGNVTMDIDDVEVVEFNALGGADAIVVNDLTGTDVTSVVLNLAGAIGGTDGQADGTIVRGTNSNDTVTLASDSVGAVTVSGLRAAVIITAADRALDSLTVDCQGGTDTVRASGLAAGVIQLSLPNCETVQ